MDEISFYDDCHKAAAIDELTTGMSVSSIREEYSIRFVGWLEIEGV